MLAISIRIIFILFEVLFHGCFSFFQFEFIFILPDSLQFYLSFFSLISFTCMVSLLSYILQLIYRAYRRLKKFTLRQVFIKVYRLEILSVMLVFSTQLSDFKQISRKGGPILYLVRPARMRSSVPLLEPGPPRFFWWYKNSE